MKITVITPTTYSKYLEQCVDSVLSQTHTDIQYILVVDGVSSPKLTTKQAKMLQDKRISTITLPFKTGINQYNGHRIYGAMNYLAEGEWICYLDEDNWFDEHHIESCIESTPNSEWVYSFRTIVAADNTMICQDNCESLGHWNNINNTQFVDVGCFFLNRQLAVKYSPLWYRQARVQGVEEVDRILTRYLFGNGHRATATKQYTLNYRVGNTALSVTKEFFLDGNQKMLAAYHQQLPWHK